MCGRTACTLSPSDLRSACQFKSKTTQQITQPEYKPSPDDKEYKPSYNIPPTSYCPVLFCGDLINESFERIIQPMRWGLIPSYFTGKEKEFSYITSNARYEGITTKHFFSNALKKGYRCVVPIEGFYEWGRDRVTGKKAFFITSRDKKPVMMLAGLFDINRSVNKSVPFYSYTIITLESVEPLKHIHNRMPAILSSDEEINFWLNSTDIPASKALSFLRSHEDIVMYPVSSTVNSTKNDSRECIIPLSSKISASTILKCSNSTSSSNPSNILTMWLKRNSSSEITNSELESEIEEETIPNKKSKF